MACSNFGLRTAIDYWVPGPTLNLISFPQRTRYEEACLTLAKRYVLFECLNG